MLRRGTSHWFVFDLLDGGVCVCVPRALEGGEWGSWTQALFSAK